MPDKKKGSKSSSQPPSKQRRPQQPLVSDQQLEQDADEMAEKAQKVEQKYDEDHDIFTK
jgi:hypothetical protein